jgi:putative component of membrane protein insertase Oxa1/YidC/SpoIIIJ protein YidD
MYWLILPKSKRRRCLFKKSCSNYVYEATMEKGLFHGVKALRFRIKNCNPDYNIIDIGKEKMLITKTHQAFKEKEISSFLLE